ncbi:conserved peptide 10 [Salvia divinorum]|uniref:Conserved peptide 10 n=1 Tax=Salvia divinorum TaxID=28513 RepID=A0ABD1G439_SALDI
MEDFSIQSVENSQSRFLLPKLGDKEPPGSFCLNYNHQLFISFHSFCRKKLNDLMESKGGKKKSSSSKSLFYEAPLGYSIEDVRPNGGIKKFRSAAYSNCARKPS